MRRKMEGGRTVSGVVVKNKYTVQSYINVCFDTYKSLWVRII